MKKRIKKIDDALLRINVWISFKSSTKTAYSGVEYPYKAIAPSSGVECTFRNINDVYVEILELYDEAVSKGFKLGEALYSQCLFFTSPEALVDSEMQNTIKEYSYSKAFNCPPYPSINQTPAKVVDDFLLIDEEHTQCIKKDDKNA